MLIGILAGLATCALWGLTFVAPRAVAPFSTWDLLVVRYGLFGITSLLLMLHPRLRLPRMPIAQAARGLLFGCVSAIGYFVSVAYAVKLAGAAIPPLIVGIAPVLLAIVANRRDASLPWGRLAWPLGFILAGLLIVNIDGIGQAPPGHGMALLLGIAFSGVALAAWAGFGWVNARVMQGPNPPDGLHWTGLQGLGAGLGALLLIPAVSLEHFSIAPPAARLSFLFWVVLMGLVGSWVATWLWVVASRRLPLALLSQLIVGETVFGLTYGFIFERRLPTAPETVGSLLQLLGVVVAIALFTRTKRRAVPLVPGPQCALEIPQS